MQKVNLNIRTQVFFILILLGMIGMFQNCGKVAFNKAVDPAASSLEGPTSIEDPIEIPNESPTPIPTPTPPSSTPTPSPSPSPSPSPTPSCPDGSNYDGKTCVKCNVGETWIDNQCKQTLFTECKTFVELDTSNSPIIVDTLANTGKCYYKKILNSVPLHSSGTNGEKRALDVLSRDHQNYTTITPSNPFILGDTSLNFVFLGNRTVSLSSTGNADPSTGKLYIDNFFLVEAREAGNLKYTLARGTADAEPWASTSKTSTKDITVDGVPVTDFISYAQGGTAKVGYIDISNGFTPAVETQLRVRLLDCGGSAEASDVYIIIR